MYPSLSLPRALIITSTVVFSGLALGSATGSWAADHATDPYRPLDRLARMMTTIETRYVDPRSPDELVDAAITGMVATLDPHSTWLTAAQAADLRAGNAPTYVGVGVTLRGTADGAEILDITPSGPADRDGLAPGDVIVAIDGQSTARQPMDVLSGLLSGARGTEVTVTIQRSRWPTDREFTLVRDRVDHNPVEWARLDDITYVHLTQFQHGAGDRVHDALTESASLGPIRGIALDLRDNPGGIIEEAVAVADLFLDEGVVVSTRGRTHDVEEFRASPGGVGPDMPVVVLVNGMSASASEIVAAALQDTHRGTLVGTHTYGKGTVQVLFESQDGAALKLTVARYFTPSGETITPDVGRTPDVLVQMPRLPSPQTALLDTIEGLDIDAASRDLLLAKVRALPPQDVTHAPVPWGTAAAQREAADPQLHAALELLRVSP